jgi:hypothetical protein
MLQTAFVNNRSLTNASTVVENDAKWVKATFSTLWPVIDACTISFPILKRKKTPEVLYWLTDGNLVFGYKITPENQINPQPFPVL